jgi:ComF family protein
MPNPLASSVKLVGRLRDGAAALLYPQCCQLCGAGVESWRDGVACARCWGEGGAGSFLPCAKCGAFVINRPSPKEAKDSTARCGRCDLRAFTAARSCGRYAGALRASVLRLKTHPHLPPRLGALLGETFDRFPARAEIESLVPVPLHPSRLAERGFNQAELIARALSASCGLPADSAALVRVKATEKHRAGMDAEARAESLDAAFKVRAPRLIEGRTLLVVDDVMTTGATADEVAATLLEAGARAVYALTLAHAASPLD